MSARVEGDFPLESGSSGNTDSGAAPENLIVIVTLTPTPDNAPAQVEAVLVPTGTPEGVVAAVSPIAATEAPAVAADAPPVVATEAPAEAPATETPSATETATPTTTSTQTPSVTPTPTRTRVPTPSPTPSPEATVPRIGGLAPVETQILAAHNDLREDRGLDMVITNSTLMAIARERAASMASQGSMTHFNVDGSTIFGMMAAVGYSYGTGAENIHYNYGYSRQQSWKIAMQEFINSPEHYTAMVAPAHRRIGIGVVTGADGYTYYSVVFSD